MKIVLTLIMLLYSLYLNAQVLTVEVTGLRNNKGEIRLAFFSVSEAFDNDDPDFEKVLSKTKYCDKGNITISFDDIPAGKYGIALLDDVNKDTKMNYNFFGIPREGFGFSDYYSSGFSRPDLSDFIFEFYNDKTVKIKVRYIY
ncbi:MAG: DUF2141 domain-containing protein [Bacteroidales bacterium]